MNKVKQWRWIPYQVHSAAENMAIDEAIMICHQQGKVPPTLRFYGWEPAACSIGYFQKVDREIDREEIQKQGLAFVRRMTGGRTVFHDQELTYSLILSEDHPLYSNSVSQSYQSISQGIMAGFSRLGLDAEWVSPPVRRSQRSTSSACFDAASDYEITIQGKKVVGSAQTRHKGVLLQHGSILIDFDVDRFFQILSFPSQKVRERMKRIFVKKAGTINEFSTSKKELAEVIEAFYHGFATGLNISLLEGSLTEEEVELANKLVKEKYSTEEWNLQR